MKKFKKGTFSWVAADYSRRVLAGKEPACWQIKAACQRYQDDFDRKDIYFDIDAVDHVCDFISNLVHTKGVWARTPIKLEPFQVFLLANAFGWLEVGTGLRRFREIFCLLTRKMGKSILAAGIALYLTFCDGEDGAEGYSGATSLEQAKEVFTPAKLMAELSPGLAEALGIETAATSVFSPTSNSSLKPVIANTKDGASPHVAVCDELHQARDDTQINAFRTGMGARSQPMLLIITTAGTNTAGICRVEQLEAEAVLSKAKTNDRLFAMIYTLDPEDDWRDFKNWRKANPNMGVSVSEEFLRERLDEALQSPAKQSSIKTKHLNMWVSGTAGWLNSNTWSKGANDALRIEDYHGQEAYLAADISTRQDLTALTVVVPHEGRKHVFPFAFLPAGALDGSPNAVAYRGWIDSGDLQDTPGNASSFEEIKDKITELCEQFKIVGAVFDPWQGEQLRQYVDGLGIATQTWPASAGALWTKSLDDFEADLKNGLIEHPNHPVLNWCALNTNIKEYGVKRTPVKPANRNAKIDLMITTLMAHALSCAEAPPQAVPMIMFI